MLHALVRTNPKGESFIGKCVNCGKENVTMQQFTTEKCPNPAGRSQEETLIVAIKGDQI